MSRSRYEPVPQQDIPPHENIILSPIHSSTYNYNTGIPSTASSIVGGPSHFYTQQTPTPYASSSAPTPPYRPPSSAPSLIRSPPPSFHTLSPPGTPRPTPSTTASTDCAELWGVADSTTAGDDDGTERGEGDGHGMLRGGNTMEALRRRVERLEESVGRLLLENQTLRATADDDDPSHSHSQCCVTYYDISPSLERAITSGRGSSCCVQFKGPGRKDREVKDWVRLGVLLLAMMMVFTILFVISVRSVLAAAAVGRKGAFELAQVGGSRR